MTVGEKIYTLRTKAGYSQEEFAEIIGVSRQSVSKWETSSAIPDTEYVVKICKLLNISTDTLLLDNDLSSLTQDEKHEVDGANVVSDNQGNCEVVRQRHSSMLSILGFVLSFFSGIAGLIVGCIALRRESSADKINHFAISGIAIGSVKIYAMIIFIAVYGVLTIVVYGGAL